MMKQLITTLLTFFTGSTLALAQPSAAALSNDSYAFLENKGQIKDQFGNSRQDIDFKFASNEILIFIGKGKMHYQWAKGTTTSGNNVLVNFLPQNHPQQIESYRMDVSLLGANENASIIAEQATAEVTQYYIPGLTAGTKAASYKKITYREVYPNIDWVIYSEGGKLEYDFIVRPGGRVSDIQLDYSGTSSLEIGPLGQLTAITPFGAVTEQRPYSYADNKTEVPSAFKLNGNVISFTTAGHSGTLTIDPMVSWATYFGGNGYGDNGVSHVQDKNGNLYIGGMASSFNNIATVGSFQNTLDGIQDAFLAKFNKDGQLIWGTYYGGTGEEWGNGVAVDTLGHVYLSGETGSTSGMSTPGSHQPVYGGGSSMDDNFLVQFDTTGARIWGTYYGGTEQDQKGRITCDGSNVYLLGATTSSGLATTGAHQTTLGGGIDLFLVKFNSAGQRQWATYYGGLSTDVDYVPSVATDRSGNVYICSSTESTSGIATAGSHQATKAGGVDMFLVKFNPSGVRQWATYYGGDGSENNPAWHNGIGFDENLNVYIGGATESTTGIATAGAYQAVHAGGWDGYLVKFNSSGVRQWGTYLGGALRDGIEAVACSDNGIYVAGFSTSTGNMTTAGSIQTVFGGNGFLDYGDAFVAKFDNAGQRLYATYFGGSSDDIILSASFQDGYLYTMGHSLGSDLGTPGSWHPNFPGGLLGNPIIAKFCFADVPTVGQISGPDSVCSNGTETYSIPAAAADDYIWTIPSGWSGNAIANTFSVHTFGNSGNITVRVVRCNDTSDVISKQITVNEPVEAIIQEHNSVLSTVNTHDSYQWYGNGQPIPNATAATYTLADNGVYFVVTIDENGCSDTSDTYEATTVAINNLARLAATITIYPNPATEMVHIISPEPVSARLSDITGKQLIRADNIKTIDVRAWAPGTYLLGIYNKDNLLIKTEKLVKL